MAQFFLVLVAGVILFVLAFAGMAAGLICGREGLHGSCADCTVPEGALEDCSLCDHESRVVARNDPKSTD